MGNKVQPGTDAPDEPNEPSAQAIHNLQKRVDAMQVELDRPDVEQMEVEGAIEFLLRQQGVWRMCIEDLNSSIFGANDTKYCGQRVHHMLFPVERDDIVPGFREGAACVYARPKRRWAQFGSMAQLLKVADENGVRLKSADRRWGREGVVRALWEHRALPGSVALLRRRDVAS